MTEQYRGPGRYSARGQEGQKTFVSMFAKPLNERPTDPDEGAWRPAQPGDRVKLGQAAIINGMACVSCRIFGAGKQG